MKSKKNKMWRRAFTRPLMRSLNVACRWNSTSFKKLKIVFGSQTGTAEAFANDFEFDARQADIDAEVVDALDMDVDKLASSDTIYALIMACYGEGEPTDNAKKFYTELMAESSTAKSLKDCQFGVFGLGNSQCFRDRFNVIGKRVDQRLENMGGKRVVALGLGNAAENISAAFTTWKVGFLEELKKLKASSTGGDSKPVQSLVAKSVPVEFRSSQGVPLALSIRQQTLVPADRPIIVAKVSNIQQLFDRTDELSSAVCLSMTLKGSRPLNPACEGVTSDAFTKNLQAGDHVGVFAPNSAHVVERFAVAAGISLNELDKPADMLGTTNTLRQVLTWQLQLTSIVASTSIKILHQWATEASMIITANHLKTFIDDYENLVRKKGFDITTILEMIPTGPRFPIIPLAALLKTLPPNAPRLYSFIHNPVTHRKTASLLCRLLRYREVRMSSNRIVDGLCSSYLNERLKEGDDIPIFFRQSNFHLPSDPSIPVIMIAGGSGIAPFLSFLEERRRLATIHGEEKLGPAVLYFGCRNPEEYMFRRELVDFLAEYSGSVLSRLIISFSAHNYDHPSFSNEEIIPGLRNIPDVVVDDAESLVPLLLNNGQIFVCGGAGNYGRAVRNTVNQLALKAKLASEVTPGDQAGVRFLVAEKRYFEDLAD